MAFEFNDAPPEPWTPPSFRDLPAPPVFQLRPPRWGSRDLRYETIAAGLHFHDDAAIRAEAVRGLRALWGAEEAEPNIARVEALWAAMDRGEELAPDDAAALDDLSGRLRRAWPALNRMAADNAAFWDGVPSIAVSLVTAGWSGQILQLPYRRDGRFVPLDLVEQVAKALARIEEEAGLQHRVAFVELSARAFELINGGAVAEAPTPSTDTAALAAEDGTDTATAILDNTAADPSAKPARRRNRKEER